MNIKPVEELVQAWADRYNKGAGWVKEIVHPEYLWIEMPSQAFPNGREGGYDFLLTAVEGNLVRNPDRQITLRRAVACGDDEAAVEWSWKGSSPAGGELTFQAMSFMQFKDDLLVREIDYLCFWKLPEEVGNFFNEDGTWRIEAVD